MILKGLVVIRLLILYISAKTPAQKWKCTWKSVLQMLQVTEFTLVFFTHFPHSLPSPNC